MSPELPMIRYTDALDGLLPEQLTGFFVGWPSPPSSATHLEMLRGSAAVVLAVDDATGRVVGFINAISDGVLAAFIPLLEVLPAYQGRGIGSELARRMLARLDSLRPCDFISTSNGDIQVREGPVLRRTDRV